MKTNTIITIGRQYGSAGRQIGRTLAEELGIKCYDKELLERAAKESGLCEELFENHDEKPTNSFLYSLVMDTYSFGYTSSAFSDMPINQKVFLAQFETIKKIASEGPCIMIGRCADYALADFDNCLSVFFHADLQTRIRRIAKIYDLTDAKAKDRIIKTDQKRSSYYNYYTSYRWGDADSYDLCIESGKFGVDGSVELLLNAIQLKEKGYNVFATGVMGIGNTTTSSAVCSVLLDQSVEKVTGKGAGLTNKDLEHKIEVIKQSIALNQVDANDPIDVLSKVGGLDIAGMVGCYIGGAALQVPVFIDGFISSVAALIAIRLIPECAPYLFPSHCSNEPAGHLILDAIGKEPYILANMCLGEGTGAVMGFTIADYAFKAYWELPSFEQTNFGTYEELN